MTRWQEIRAAALAMRDDTYRLAIAEALEKNGGNRNMTAKYLGMDRPNLRRQMRRLGLR